MGGYKAAIMKATGCTHEAAPVVEGLMREDNGGVLDSLPPASFNRQAQRAFRTYAELRSAGETETIEYFRKRGA